MPVRSCLALALVLAAGAPRLAWARGGDKHARHHDDDSNDSADDPGDDGGSDDDRGSADGDDSSDDDDDDTANKPAKHDAKPSDDEDSDDEDSGSDSDKSSETADKPANRLPEKQDLTGHDLGTDKKPNAFERDRFFVDKVDTKATEHGTLIQGSLTSTSFLYNESGGNYSGGNFGSDAASFSRMFTDLRLQTDFRHIKDSRWDGRVDARMRFVNNPPDTPFDQNANGMGGVTPVNIQSGLTGQNEYDLRELWLIRNGDRTDVTIGRQYIADLAAVKIDGVRFDYAKSKEFTLLGFGGLYPLRGSRSVTTDYVDLKKSDGTSIGQFIAAAGFGAAYRTDMAYGSFGGVILDPVQGGEQPRVFGTSTGYWRFGPKLDLYHFAVVDLIGNNDALGAGSAGLTNLSVGANFKPSPRLRATASLNRVDTETLNLQAQAFLSQPATANTTIDNEVFIKRLATTEVRGDVSAGLGELQRFEITAALAYRTRPGFDLTSPDMTTKTAIPAAQSAEVYGSFIDRRSFAGMRLGTDIVRTFALSTVGYSRSEVFALRLFAQRELASGKGEWEAEASYATTKDTATGGACTAAMDLLNCFGATSGSILSAGGTFYYRFNRDWLGIASAYLSQQTLTPAGKPADPSILGLTGFARFAYRF